MEKKCDKKWGISPPPPSFIKSKRLYKHFGCGTLCFLSYRGMKDIISEKNIDC